MRYWSIRIALLVFLAASLAGQTNEWHTYRNVEGNFSALLPGEPAENVSTDADGTTTHTVQTVSDSVVFLVVFVSAPSEQPVNETTFNVYRDAFLKGLPKCDLVKEDAPSPAVTAHVGHWYRLNCTVEEKKFIFIGNLYWGKNRAYAVLSMYPEAPSDPPAARKFINSFAVIDPDK
jgi:hypothetical protein